jgi:BirA family biotin operon repressor/biotin-[acetyl-CoA-carboxylase] ligase
MTGSPYTDLSRPPLREAVLSRGLVVPEGLWTEVRVVAETGSTNADLAEAARSGTGQGLVLIAERQRAGRGRLDRSWQAPERAAITMSVLLHPPVPPSRLGWLPLLAGVALVSAIDRVDRVGAHLKWPNDVLLALPSPVGYGKAAGILAEAANGAVVLGMGLNVSQRADELPPPSDPRAYPPTSLGLAGAATDRVPLVRAILRAIEDWYGRWCAASGDPDACGLREAYRSHCVTIGREVEVSLPGGDLTGTASDVDEDGRLLVVAADGVHTLAAGDVRHVR